VPGNPANNNEIKYVSRRKAIRLTTLIISSHFIVRYSSTVISEELESLEAADTTHSTNLLIRFNFNSKTTTKTKTYWSGFLPMASWWWFLWRAFEILIYGPDQFFMVSVCLCCCGCRKKFTSIVFTKLSFSWPPCLLLACVRVWDTNG
jgi:hypothetical protein